MRLNGGRKFCEAVWRLGMGRDWIPLRVLRGGGCSMTVKRERSCNLDHVSVRCRDYDVYLVVQLDVFSVEVVQVVTHDAL